MEIEQLRTWKTACKASRFGKSKVTFLSRVCLCFHCLLMVIWRESGLEDKVEQVKITGKFKGVSWSSGYDACLDSKRPWFQIPANPRFFSLVKRHNNHWPEIWPLSLSLSRSLALSLSRSLSFPSLFLSFLFISVCLSACLSACLSVSLSVCLSACLSVCLPVSVCLLLIRGQG